MQSQSFLKTVKSYIKMYPEADFYELSGAFPKLNSEQIKKMLKENNVKTN